MNILGQLLFFLGLILFFIGGIWFIVVTFQESILWGLACLFLPVVSFIFMIVHWPEAKKPTLLQIASFVMIFVGAFLAGYGIFKPP
jgi:uncharacterized membrane protein YhhN